MTLEQSGHDAATKNNNVQLEGSLSENIKNSGLDCKEGTSGFAQSSRHEKRQSEDEDKFYTVEDHMSKLDNNERRTNSLNSSKHYESSNDLGKQSEPVASAKAVHASDITEEADISSLSIKRDDATSNKEEIRSQCKEPSVSGLENTREPGPLDFSEEKPATAEENHVRSSSGEIVSEPNRKENASQIDASNSKKTTDDEWQEMPAVAEYDIYDDYGRLVARGLVDEQVEAQGYNNLGGAAKGYTRVQIDEDAQSATSMDDNTAYLFKEAGKDFIDDEEEARNPMEQMQATKDLLNRRSKDSLCWYY